MSKYQLHINYKQACSFGILVIFLSLLSCVPKRNSSRIIVSGAGKIISLDPAQANTFHSIQLLSALGDPLYLLDQEGKLIPKLAKSLPLKSNGGKTISIPLREDIFFHDGTPFNSDAMAFSLRRFMKIGRLNYILDGRISSIETPSKYLLRLQLSRPSSSLKGLLTSINLTPVSPSAYVNHKDKFLNEKFIGTGPYQLKSFKPHKQRIEPFKKYWGNQPKNNGIDFISFNNSTSLFIALKTGEVDVLLSDSIDADQQKHLKQMSKEGLIKEGEGPPLEIGYITFRTNIAPLNQPLLREALINSLDRNLISERVSYGLRKPLRSLIPPSLKQLKNNQPWPKYNPEYARSLFSQAGFCGERKLEIPFTFRSNVPADKLLALTWKAQINKDLSDCLNLKINGLESTTVYKQLGDGSFQAVMLDWRGSYPDPAAYLSPFLSCTEIKERTCLKGEAATSGSFWSSKWLANSLQTSDRLNGEKRLQKLREINAYAAKGGAYLPIWVVTPKAWSQNYLSLPKFDGSGHLLLDQLKSIN